MEVNIIVTYREVWNFSTLPVEPEYRQQFQAQVNYRHAGKVWLSETAHDTIEEARKDAIHYIRCFSAYKKANP